MDRKGGDDTLTQPGRGTLIWSREARSLAPCDRVRRPESCLGQRGWLAQHAQ